MNANQLVGRLGVPRKGDEKGIVASKGLGEAATRLFNRWWGLGTVVERPHVMDDTKAVYVLVK